MRVLRFDSPIMLFIGKVTDFVVLNFLWLICCIPIVTIGAATCAKYTVGMKIVREEDSAVIKPFFEAFKENFKQTTIIWLILLAVTAICTVDWLWIAQKGFDNVSNYFLIGISVLSALVVFTIISVFGLLARFEMASKEAVKAAVMFSFLHCIRFALIIALEIGTVIACMWYFKWLPLIGLFGTTSAFYFVCVLFVKEFTKMEENYFGKKEDDYNEEEAIFKDESRAKENENNG